MPCHVAAAGGRLKCHLKNGTKLDGCRRISQYFEGLRTDPQSATDEADMSVPGEYSSARAVDVRVCAATNLWI
jgi:hypothetical protein